jgi:hypothetical protein
MSTGDWWFEWLRRQCNQDSEPFKRVAGAATPQISNSFQDRLRYRAGLRAIEF